MPNNMKVEGRTIFLFLNLQYPTKFDCHFTAEVLHFLKSLCEKLKGFDAKKWHN